MSLMDVARGAYTRSPAALRRSLAPLVSLVPTRLKFGASYRQWRADIARSATDPAYAADRHIASLRALMAKAHAHSPFYRDLLDSALGASFDYAGFTTKDLKRLPILSKADLRAAVDAVDDYIDANAASLNAALPQPFRSAATAQQKALVFALVALRRAGVI